MPPLKAVLFDLDNTLFHWDPCDQRGREAAHRILLEATGISFEQFMELHNAARDHLKKQLHGQASNHNRVLFFKFIVDQLASEPQPALVLEMHAHYWRAFFEGIIPHPDAIHVLTQLKQTCKLALVSNHVAQPQLEKVIRLNFARHFQAIITSEEAGIEKPHQKIYQIALDRLGVVAAEAVMIGDHPRGDIEGASLAGLRSIFMNEYTPDEPVPECATAVVNRLVDVLPILIAWQETAAI